MKEEKLLLLLKRKKGFFEAILELSEIESELGIKDWISILEQKKVLLSCIEEIDGQLIPYHASLHTISQDITEELENIRQVIRKILHIDAANHEKRKKQLDVKMKEIKSK